MSASVVNSGGRRTWVGSRTAEGMRNWKLTFHVEVTDPENDGPATVMQAAGLPEIGSVWNFGNDIDIWAFYTGQCDVKSNSTTKTPGPVKHWDVTCHYSTMARQRCQDIQIEDPLDEPDRISGSFVKYTTQATRNRFGFPLKYSSHEIITGPETEFDANRPTVTIEQTVANLELSLFNTMVDTVNAVPMWGVDARWVKLSDCSWSRMLYGTCDYYFIRRFTFDVARDAYTFDHRVIDRGRKLLNGHWDPDTKVWTLDNINGSPPSATNPAHFVVAKDINGDNLSQPLFLNGEGKPITNADGTPSATSGGATPYVFDIEYYEESDFLLLGIPGSLE